MLLISSRISCMKGWRQDHGIVNIDSDPIEDSSSRLQLWNTLISKKWCETMDNTMTYGPFTNKLSTTTTTKGNGLITRSSKFWICKKMYCSINLMRTCRPPSHDLHLLFFAVVSTRSHSPSGMEFHKGCRHNPQKLLTLLRCRPTSAV